MAHLLRLRDWLAYLAVIHVIPCPCRGWVFRLQLALLPYAGKHAYEAAAQDEDEG